MSYNTRLSGWETLFALAATAGLIWMQATGLLGAALLWIFAAAFAIICVRFSALLLRLLWP